MIDAIRQMIGMDARSYALRVPREEEAEGQFQIGDTVAANPLIFQTKYGSLESNDGKIKRRS